MGRCRVLIAEDESSLRESLAAVISMDESLELVGAAGDAQQAIDLARQHRPDVALLDVRMPAGGGPRAAREIRESCPGTRVLALSAYGDRGTLLEMLRAGASGYLVKGASVGEITSAIRRSGQGEGTLSNEIAADVISELVARLEREEHEAERSSDLARRVRRLAAGEGLGVVFQPIANLHTGRVVGVEALARFSVEPERPPNAWFTDAWRVGLGAELELAALRRAFGELEGVPGEMYLAVNLSPQTLLSPEFLEALRPLPLDRFVMEITEHAPIEDYEAVRVPIIQLRARGGRLAVDDAGAGFASLRHILRMAPDLMKLDVELTRDIHREPRHRALASALIRFASEIGCEVVAEGIETREELDALRDLGVSFGQGYYLARPKPLRGLDLSQVARVVTDSPGAA